MVGHEIIIIVWLHFVGDFVLQSDKMAKDKATCSDALLYHTVAYSAPFLMFGWKFALITFILHTATDYITSKVARGFYCRKQTHWWFVTIGFDQALHLTALILTYSYLC